MAMIKGEKKFECGNTLKWYFIIRQSAQLPIYEVEALPKDRRGVKDIKRDENGNPIEFLIQCDCGYNHTFEHPYKETN